MQYEGDNNANPGPDGQAPDWWHTPPLWAQVIGNALGVDVSGQGNDVQPAMSRAPGSNMVPPEEGDSIPLGRLRGEDDFGGYHADEGPVMNPSMGAWGRGGQEIGPPQMLPSPAYNSDLEMGPPPAPPDENPPMYPDFPSGQWNSMSPITTPWQEQRWQQEESSA